MQIKIISVEKSAVPGKKYSKIEVAFKNDKGEVKGKNIMDFSIKSGLNYLLEAKPNDVLDVTTVKNGEYLNWEHIVPAGQASPAGSVAPSATPTKGYSAPTRDFESKEERAARQVMIVRQSSLSTAVSLLKTEKNVPSVNEILEVATIFEDFVMRTKSPVAEVVEMESDVPY